MAKHNLTHDFERFPSTGCKSRSVPSQVMWSQFDADQFTGLNHDHSCSRVGYGKDPLIRFNPFDLDIFLESVSYFFWDEDNLHFFSAFWVGYNAETVSSGEEAVAYVKENPVDLIVIDMVMPKGINGRETYEEIIKIRPGQKAIKASGYAKTKEVDLAQELGAGKYIKKPYSLAKVGLAVKAELEK